MTRDSLLRRVWILVRSRRVAIYLLVGLTVFMWIATLYPLGTIESATVREWAQKHPFAESIIGPLGLHEPYSTPLFLAVAIWLAVSTCACAVERSLGSLRVYRSLGRLSRDDVTRLESRPTARFAAPTGVTPQEAIELAEESLRDCRMAMRRGGLALSAYSRSIGLLGSPLFHIAMGLLVVFGGAGWISRAEGTIALVLDRPIIENRQAYLPGLTTGPLFRKGFSGRQLTLLGGDGAYTVDGVDRGPAVRLRAASSDGRRSKEATVYPNHPLVYGNTVIHYRGRSGAVLVATATRAGETTAPPAALLFQPDADTASGIAPLDIDLNLPDGKILALRLEPVEGRRVAVTVRGSAANDSGRKVLKMGETAKLPGGARFTAVSLSRWAEVSVVHDWVVPFLYLMFVLGSLGTALTVFTPNRRVHAKLQDVDSDTLGGRVSLNVVVHARQSDPAFKLRVVEALEHKGFERIVEDAS